MIPNKKLYRSTDQKMLAGVAGGIAEHFGVDPLIIRILFIALVVAGGGGFLIYFLLWFLVPKNPDLVIRFEDDDEPERPAAGGTKILMKALAAAFLVAAIISWYVDGVFFVPFALSIAIGLYYFSRSSDTISLSERFDLHRSAGDRKILGVFGGLSEKYGVDATLLRVIGVVLLVVGGGVMIPLYLLYALLIPVEDAEADVERIVII